MIAFFDNIHELLPAIIILVTSCLVLIADLFFKNHSKYLGLIVAGIGLLLALMVSFLFIGEFKVVLLNRLLVSDDLSKIMTIFICGSVLLSFVYSYRYLVDHNLPVNDYYILGLFSTLGMIILVSAHSLLTVYLGLELLSLPIYAMAATARNNGLAVESALKYFVMGSIASALLLYGFSLIYGATAALDLLDIANAVVINGAQQKQFLAFALVFIIAGIGFKLAAPPFHMWAPDVYAGAPGCVTMFISAAPKIAALGMALRLLTEGLGGLVISWQHLLLVMSILAVVLGNLFAIVQVNIKRLFAYSAIGHAGYALFGILAGTGSGYAAALYYVVVYALMTVAALGFVVILSYRDKEILLIDDLRGLNKKSPWLALMMLIVLFSLAGVPPTAGFFTKLLVLKALVDVKMVWVAVIGLIGAVVGAFYYIRIIKVMYFDSCADNTLNIQIAWPMQTLFSLNCLILLYLGIFPTGLITTCINAFS